MPDEKFEGTEFVIRIAGLKLPQEEVDRISLCIKGAALSALAETDIPKVVEIMPDALGRTLGRIPGMNLKVEEE